MTRAAPRTARAPGASAADALALAFVALVVYAAPARAAAEATFDYLYIEANEGGSSGGHAGIVVGDHVYHFQNQNGLLVLNRERADTFLYAYALLGNRTIHVSRIAVAEEGLNKIRAQLARRHRAQEAQLAVLETLRADRSLVERDLRADAATGRLPIEVPGLGFFAPGGGDLEERDVPAPADPPAEGAGNPAIVSLREAVSLAYGPYFLATRRAALLRELSRHAAADPAGWQLTLPDSPYAHPPFTVAWSTSLAQVAAGLAALDNLERAPALAAEAVHAPPDAAFELEPADRTALERFQQVLARDLVDVAASRRADWGHVLLVGMARLAALQASLDRGRLVFLDGFPADASVLRRGAVDRNRDIFPELLAEALAQLERSRARLRRAEAPTELLFERFEERANRYHELLRATRGDDGLRIQRGHLTPSRAAVFLLPSPGHTEAVRERKAAFGRVREREDAYADGLAELYGYQLLTRNCVSALFETLNDSLGGSRAHSEAALGGWVDGQRELGFIPFVSADQVNARFRVVHREVIPSFRQARLEEMRARDAGFLARLRTKLRESNTFTSTAYRRGEEDSFFVFFTDDATVLRPLYGAVNLVGAVGETVFGFVKLPLDRGRTLLSGLSGTFMSLPELAFFNIRKGSNDWIAPELRVPRQEPVLARGAPKTSR